ncbi:MAG: hypothetical protein KGI70_02455 [Patescibacteria group bacterium]|nr:hypothetical protein [Patescibacteria group bacterium]
MNKTANLILRAGVAFAFLYPPLNAAVDPSAWVGYLPPWLTLAPPLVELHVFGVIEIGIALWILSGWRVVWPAAAAVVALLGIVVLQLSEFQVVFRDLSIAAAAAALALDAYTKPPVLH